MTSTNDGKDVKSNQTSGQKGKIYYIELYKSLEAHLSAEGELRERTQHLCDAWRHIYTLCLHSAHSTHPHLFSWLQKHTARTVLQSDWQSPRYKDEHAILETAIGNFIEECKSAISSRNGVSHSWECQLLQRADWFKNVLSNPWGHPVLKLLLDPTTKQPSDEEILEWLKEERGVMFVTRLRQLAASKCDDLAMALTTAVMDRARASSTLVPDVEQSVEPPDKPGPQNIDTEFADILRTEAGFTSDIWELLTDIEFVLLHKLEKTSRCIELAKQTRLRIGYQLVERLRSRLGTSPREKKLWKNAKDVATLIAQVIIARCMVIPICAGVSRAALYCCTRSLAQLVTPARLPAVAAALAAPAATAKHLHTLASAMDAQRKDMKPFVCELYVRAITAGMNELERLKLKTEKESEARSAAQILSTWFTQLGSLLSNSARIKCECALTAFSVYPSRAMYDQIRAAPPLSPVAVDAQELKPETTSEFGSWANDSRSKTNFVKTSETLNMKHTQQQANVLSTAILTEGEALGLSAELCQDLAVLLSGPRLKTLSWDMDRQLLLENCHMYVERTNGGTRTLTTELKYLNLDLSHFQHLPEEEDDENDVYYGIEKGYEHLVELQEPEEIWQKDFFDSEETETANSCMEDDVQSMQTKKKVPCYVISSEEDTDPLSLLADAKRTEKKKERPHSKERSKEHRRRSKSNIRESSINKEYSCERRKEISHSREKKKERKERKRKEKQDKAQCTGPDPLTNLLGMKVAEMPLVIGEDREIKINKKKGRRRKHRENIKLNTTSVTDSDYDSQGKLSLASLNSEGNDQNVLFDGLFCMDDYKSPEVPTQNSLTLTSKQNSSNQTDSIQQPRLYNSTEQNISSRQVSFNNVDKTNEPNTQKNTLCNDVKQNIMKLLQFRKNNSKASNVPREVNNMVSNGNSGQNVFISSPVTTEHQPAKNASPMVSSHPHTNTNDQKCLDNSRLNPNKQSQKLTAVSNFQNTHVKENVIQNPSNLGQNVSTQTEPIILKPLQSYERDQKNVHQNEPTYTQKVVVENVPQFHSRVDDNTLKQSSNPPQGNLIQNTLEQTSQGTETPHQRRFHDFLKGFHQTINAGVVSDKSNKSSVIKETVIGTVDSTPVNKPVPYSNIKRAESTLSPYSAKQFQQKKVENVPNTFARLSYMHKNKQNDIKPKQTIDQIPHKQLSEKERVSVELDRLVAEFKNAKYKNDLTISRITNPCQTANPKDNAQTLIRKHVKPSTSKSVTENSISLQTNHYKQPNKPSVLMQDPISRMKTQNLNLPMEQPSKQLTITNKNTKTMLSERDQADLLLLLRQQSRLNMPIITNKIAGSLQTFNNLQKNSASNSYNSMTSTNILSQNRHSVEAQTNISKIKIDHTQNVNIKKIQPQQNPSTTNPIASLETNTTQKTALHTNIDPIKLGAKNVDTNNTDKKLNWKSVMNDLLSHKTPSRGPNNLDLALSTDSTRITSDNSLRNQRIVRGESDKVIKPITDLRASKSVTQISKQVRSAQNDAVIKQLPQNNVKQYGKASILNHVSNSASHSTKTNLSTPGQPQATKQQVLHKTYNKNKKNTNYIKQYKQSCAAKSTNHPISGTQILNTLKPTVSDSVKRQQSTPKAEPDKLVKVFSNVKLGQVNVPSTDNPNRVIHSNNITLRLTGSDNLKTQSLTEVLKKTSQIEVTKRASTEFQKKRIPVQFTKDNDPFISGIPNSDYDLLEELMDDELRQEIGELSSDDETYRSQTVIVSKVTKDNANNINSLKKLTSSTGLKQVNSKSVFDGKQIIREPLKQPNLKSSLRCHTNTTIIETPLKEGNCINNGGVPDCTTKLSRKLQTAQIPNVVQALPSTNVNQQSYNNNKKTITTQVGVAETSSLYVTTVPQTTKLQNVVLIDPGLVYNQYNRLQVQETQVNVNLYNVNQSPYVAINTPNITLYQSTQFAAPVVNPVIIGNVLSSSVPSTSLEASHTVQDAFTAQPIINKHTNPNCEVTKQPDMFKIVKTEKNSDSILEEHQHINPKLTTQLPTHLNVISKTPTSQYHADKPTNLIDNSNKINVVQNTLIDLNIERKLNIIPDQRLHIDVNPKLESKTSPDLNSSKTCERKVLSQVQEKQKLTSPEKFDSKNVKNRTILTEAEIKKDTLKDQERLQKKRLAIITRKTHHYSYYPPIPLFYTPLNTIKLNSNIKERENVLESNDMNKNKEDNEMNELKTIKFASSIHETKTVMYKNILVSEEPKENIGEESNSANTNSIQTNTQSDFDITVPNLSNENCKENKDTSQCQRILLRSSNKLKDKVIASIVNTKNTVGRKRKVRLKATANDEDADKDRNINKNKDVITQSKCISKRRRNKKIIIKKSLSKFSRKNDIKPVFEKLKTAIPPVTIQQDITELKCIDIEEELIGSKIPKYQPNIVKTTIEETTGCQNSEPFIAPIETDINEHTSENNQHEKHKKCLKNQCNNPNCKHINDNNSHKLKTITKNTENINATISKQEILNSVSEEFASELEASNEIVQNMFQENTKQLDIENEDVTNEPQDHIKSNNKVKEKSLFLKNRDNKSDENISTQQALNHLEGHDEDKSVKSIQSRNTNKNISQDHKSNDKVKENTLFLKNRDNKNDQNISTQQVLSQLVGHDKDKSVKSIPSKNTNKNVPQDHIKSNNKVKEKSLFLKNRDNKNDQNISTQQILNQLVGHDKDKSVKSIQSRNNNKNLPQDHIKSNNKVKENALFLKNGDNKNDENISTQQAVNQLVGHDKDISVKRIQSKNTNENLPQDRIKRNNKVKEKALFLKNGDNKNDQNISTQQAPNVLVGHNEDKSVNSIQSRNTNKLKKNTKEENQLNPEVQSIGVIDNNIEKSSYETLENENNDHRSFGSAFSIPQSYKDSIKIVELPNNDPFKKQLRIKLPNGDSFTATVTGQRINFDFLLSHPSFRSILISGLTDKNQFPQSDKINNKAVIKARIKNYNITVNKPQSEVVQTMKPQSDVETINLISDDEDDESFQIFKTEFGHFKIKSIKQDTYMKHQKIFALKSFIKLKRCNANNNDFNTKNQSALYKKSITNYLNKGLQIDNKVKQKSEFSELDSKDNENNTTIPKPDSNFSEVIEIDDRTSNENLSKTNSCDVINSKIMQSTLKINKLRHLILQELGVEKVKTQGKFSIQNISDLQHKEEPPSQKEATVKKYSNQDKEYILSIADNKKCQLKLTKCDEDIKKYKVMEIINKKCFVNLVRCDDLVEKMSQNIIPCNDILQIDSDSNVETGFEVKSAKIDGSLSRCGSYSILNSLLLYEDEAITSIPNVSCDRSSPVMEIFDTIASLHNISDNILDSIPSSEVLDKVSLIKCDSEWLSTKHELHLQNRNKTVESKKVNLTDCKMDLIAMEIFDTNPPLHNISDNIFDSTQSAVLDTVSLIKCDSEWFSTKHELYLQNLKKTDEFKKINLTDCKTDLIAMESFDKIPSLHNISDNILDSTQSSHVLKNVSLIKCDSEWFSTKQQLSLLYVNKMVESKKVKLTDCKSNFVTIDIYESRDDISICDSRSTPTEFFEVPKLVTIMTTFFENNSLINILKPVNKISKQPSRNLKRKLSCTNEYELSKLRTPLGKFGRGIRNIDIKSQLNNNANCNEALYYKHNKATEIITANQCEFIRNDVKNAMLKIHTNDIQSKMARIENYQNIENNVESNNDTTENELLNNIATKDSTDKNSGKNITIVTISTTTCPNECDNDLKIINNDVVLDLKTPNLIDNVIDIIPSGKENRKMDLDGIGTSMHTKTSEMENNTLEITTKDVVYEDKINKEALTGNKTDKKISKNDVASAYQDENKTTSFSQDTITKNGNIEKNEKIINDIDDNNIIRTSVIEKNSISAVNITHFEKNENDNNDGIERSSGIMYEDDCGVVLQGIEYDDPVEGSCYFFPLENSNEIASTDNEFKVNKDDSVVHNEIKNYLYEDKEMEFKVIAPKTTYSKGNMKRKTNMKDIKVPEKKYRKGKNIDYPKFTSATVNNSSYTKEYKLLFDYCSSLKFSYSRPFHKESIETSEIIKDWPIKGNVEVQCKNIEIDDTLFDDFEIKNRTTIVDPLNQTLAEELTVEYKENDGVTLSGNISETNFNMGFGEGSGRVIQNLEDGDDISKFSAATLSDVKQSQPFLLSENYDCENNKSIPLVKSDQQIEKIKRYATCIQLREKVRSFFKKTSYELNYDKYLKSKYRGLKFDAFDLCSSEFIEPYPIETIVQVVQVGQLPVSAAAQNPVTCDPRVTQVSDASPSQCSAENSPRDDSQSALKTEYTELTTADLTLPLVQEFTQQDQNITVDVHDTTSMPMTDQNIPIEMEIKAEMKSVIKDERNEIKDQNNSHDKHELQSMPAINNIEYSYESNDTNASLESDPNVQIMFNSSEQQSSSENFSQQKQHNGSTEKTDQIAHAMNAAGITTTTETLPNNRAHALVNILSQKIRHGSVSTTQSSSNNYPKTSINAMALQQALAQILPPPLNQTNATDTNQQAQSASVTPQVLHIVQGKNATGNQITLVDNTQQSVISTPNAQVLHIVQNKGNTTGPTCNGNSAPQSNAFSGLSLVDAGLQQGGNQLLHIVNTGNQKNNNTGQLLKRVNLLTNLTNVQGSNEQKMVQFVCKSADGKAIQLNASHQRSMVLRLQPIESPNVQTTQQKPVDSQDLSPTASTTNSVPVKETVTSQQEIKSRSVYEENYAKFIQNSSSKPTVVEKSTSLPKFNQAFGKPVFQDGNQKQNEINTNNTHLPTVNTNSDNTECQSNDNAINLEHIGQINSPPLLLRKSPAQASQAQTNLVQQIKQTIAPMNIQTMHGGVIYTRQIPVNIGGGQTINLITVPSTELIDDSAQKQQSDVKFVNQNEIEPSIIKIVPQSQTASNAEVSTEEGNNHIGVTNENTQNPQPQPVLTQMRIKLPMLSKTPQMVPGARVVRPSFFQIQRNVIGGTNQPVYQQLVLTAAPPLGQQTIRLPQTQTNRQVKVPTETQSSSESQMSSSTLEQLREFDMVLEQVKERSTVQPNTISNSSFSKMHASSSDTTDSPISASSTESTQQVLYSIGNNQPLNVAYVNRKATVTTPTTSTYVRSPDSSGIADSPTSTHVQLPHTVTSDSSPGDTPTQPKQPKVGSKSKSRPKSSSNPPNSMKINTVPPKTSVQKPLEDEQTTQRILYILAEYKEQVENSPDKDKPAPRRRSNPPSNPSGSSKRKKSSSGSRRPGVRDLSPVHADDTCRTMGSEDSSCGTSQGDCTESCLESHSPQDSPRKVARKLTFEQDTSASQPRPQPQRNVIVADGQTITVARGTAGKPATAVLMPANYILPVSMVKGGQQIAIVTNRGPKLLTVGGGEGGATNALLLQRLIGPAGLKPVLARPGVRHVRLPTAALHNLQAFNLATTTTVHPPDSTASPAPAPTPELVETRATSSPWTDREAQDVKPERGSSPEGSEPWNLPSSADPHDYTYEETVRADNMDRTVLVVQKKDGSSQRQHRLTHVSAAALRHKYAILEHELRLQKSLSEECEDLGVDSPSASELFPEAELLFAASPAHDHTQDHGHHSHTPQPTLLSQSSSIPQPDIDDQIATDQLIPRENINERQDLNLGLEDVGIVTVSEDGMQATIALDQEEFARSHPNTTFHSEPTDGEVQPFTISGLKGRHITSTIFHSNSAPATVLMTAPQTTVISQATAETSNSQNTVKYSDIDNMINLPGTHGSDINLSSVLVKDDGLTRFDSILTDSRELHLSNTASAIVHSGANATQVIRRVCYQDDKRERDTRFLMDEPDTLIAGDDAKMIAEDSSRDATLESIAGDVDDDRSSPERHAELFWESNSASERSESRRPLDFSSDSDKCCKSPSYDETNSTDSSGVGTHMRLDSVIKEARGRERSRSADGSSADDTHPPLRTYPPKRLYHPLEGELERSMSGKTRAGERSPDSLEVRRRASGRGVVKRGCHCCNGSPAPPRPKKSRQKKPTMDFSTNN